MGGRIKSRPGRGMCATVGFALSVALAADSASGQLAFSEVTAQSQIDFVHHDPDLGVFDNSWWVGTGAAIADYDLDGDLDVYLVDSFGWPNQLYRNNGDKTFTNVTEESGLGDTGGGSMGLFVDLDNDGDPDLVVANNTDSIYGTLTPAQLFRNDGAGPFTNVTDGSGFEPQGILVGGMAATDYNQDGLLDLYVVYWDHNSDAPYNYLYRNDGDLKFTDVTALVGLDATNTQVRTWTPVFVDLDGDGLQDLYAAVDFDANYMFRLDFDGVDYVFTDVSAEADIQHVGNDMGVAVGDCNGDGLVDLFSTNITFEPPNELERTNAFYINQGFPEPFTEEAVDRGVWQSYWGWGTVFFDAELDGDLDIFSVGGRPVDYYGDKPGQLFVNDGSGFYEDLGAEAGADLVGDSRGLVAFDYDADGDQDLLIVNVLTPVALLENVSTHNHHWLTVRPIGQVGNRDAIGAKMWLTADGATQFREVMSGTSFYASMPSEQNFGTGEATIVDQLRIDWPGGATTEMVNVPVDQVLTVTEGVLHPPVLAFFAVSGPTSSNEQVTIYFSAEAEFYYDQSRDVTGEADWTVVVGDQHASFSEPGVLLIGDVLTNQIVEVRATFEGWESSLSLTVVDLNTPDEQPPIVSITSPTVENDWSTFDQMITLAGTSEDDVAIASVVWMRDSVGQGPCGGLSIWTTGPIELAEGENVLTVMARDTVGNTGSDQITITLLPPVADGPPGLPPTDDVPDAPDDDLPMDEDPVAPDDNPPDDSPPADSDDTTPIEDGGDAGEPTDGTPVDEPLPPDEDSDEPQVTEDRSAAPTCGVLGASVLIVMVAGLTLMRSRH